MKCIIFLIISVQFLLLVCGQELPTLYEYYTQPNITSGLSADQPYFLLNGKNISIYSGALHYFRVHPDYWRDRLRLIRAAGLNAVETYLPWNLNQPRRNQLDLGDGGNDFSPFLNVTRFIQLAQEEDLFVILRPGPYICAEWEFGGMPSWVLREDKMTVRSSDPKFLALVKDYYDALIPILAKFEFTRGGPVIAVQVENEYGNVANSEDTPYLEYIKNLLISNGFNSTLLVTSGSPNGRGTLPGILATANFQDNPQSELNKLKALQPNRPMMVMEYWSGWFDHWLENHHTRALSTFGNNLEVILSYPASVNFYMFIGSTNWGFLNGANIADSSTDNSALQPTTSSYDYDAPVTEAGNRTDKWFRTQELIAQYNPIKTRVPDPPKWVPSIAYENVLVVEYLTLSDLLGQSQNVNSNTLLPMELLPVNDNNGQSFGYTVYETTANIPINGNLVIEGHVCDTIVVLINGNPYTKAPEKASDINGFGFWRQKNSQLAIGNQQAISNAKVQLLVENFGRNNYGELNQFNQFKGLWQGNVLINGTVLSNWTITPLEFGQNWTNSLSNWRSLNNSSSVLGPAIYKGVLTVNEEPRDSYFDLRNWQKGIVIVNNFVLSRHFRLGSQLFAYLPAPLLKRGNNTILVFDHYAGSDTIAFSDRPIFENVS